MPDSGTLLAWYDRHRRALPWRAAPGIRPDPYRVWLSEIMLQQTTVATVGPYFDRFVARWPDISALAAASLDEVLHLWQGLGYYARARNLHVCARTIVEQHGGTFPDEPEALRALPGIGDYTAAAIAAIAFDRRGAAIDGNVERVVARLYAVCEPLPLAKARLRALAAAMVPDRRAGDFAQALMDLGATICTPRRPRCVLCPWRSCCAAAASGRAEDLPARGEKPERPVRHGFTHFLLNLAVVAGTGVADGIWSPVEQLGDHALPTLMKKVARHAISALAAGTYWGSTASAAKSGRSPSAASRTGANERR